MPTQPQPQQTIQLQRRQHQRQQQQQAGEQLAQGRMLPRIAGCLLQSRALQGRRTRPRTALRGQRRRKRGTAQPPTLPQQQSSRQPGGR